LLLLGSVDVLSKILIYIFQLDNFDHGFLQRNSGKDNRYLQAKNTIPSFGRHHSLMVWRYPVDLLF